MCFYALKTQNDINFIFKTLSYIIFRGTKNENCILYITLTRNIFPVYCSKTLKKILKLQRIE